LQSLIDIFTQSNLTEYIPGVTDLHIHYLLLITVRTQVSFGGHDEFFNIFGREVFAYLATLIEEVEFYTGDAVD